MSRLIWYTVIHYIAPSDIEGHYAEFKHWTRYRKNLTKAGAWKVLKKELLESCNNCATPEEIEQKTEWMQRTLRKSGIISVYNECIG